MLHLYAKLWTKNGRAIVRANKSEKCKRKKYIFKKTWPGSIIIRQSIPKKDEGLQNSFTFFFFSFFFVNSLYLSKMFVVSFVLLLCSVMGAGYLVVDFWALLFYSVWLFILISHFCNITVVRDTVSQLQNIKLAIKINTKMAYGESAWINKKKKALKSCECQSGSTKANLFGILNEHNLVK